MKQDRKQRKTKLTPEHKWQIFLESSRKNTTDAEICRKWGTSPYRLKAIRAKTGSFEAFKKVPGRSKADPEIVQLREELQRSNEALKKLAIENIPLPGKIDGVSLADLIDQPRVAKLVPHALTAEEKVEILVGADEQELAGEPTATLPIVCPDRAGCTARSPRH